MTLPPSTRVDHAFETWFHEQYPDWPLAIRVSLLDAGASLSLVTLEAVTDQWEDDIRDTALDAFEAAWELAYEQGLADGRKETTRGTSALPRNALYSRERR